jgi:hypothetical protein
MPNILTMAMVWSFEALAYSIPCGHGLLIASAWRTVTAFTTPQWCGVPAPPAMHKELLCSRSRLC